jgi:cysteinyl-tRNA synthetase
MDDDLNTAAALAVLFELARPLRSLANRLERGDAAAAAEAAQPLSVTQAALLRELAAVLGLRQEAASTAGPAEAGASDASPGDAEIEALIETRQAAKASRDFAKADRIRDALRAQGIELIDRPGGITEWLRR